jgi:hypothetical protein
MALQPRSPEEEQKIIRDCVKAARDIKSMTDRAYNFLYLSCGFIAHYNKFCFMEHYEEPGSLKKAIFEYQRYNQYGNFSPRDKDYDYYMQKTKIYNTICDCLKQGIEYKSKPKRQKETEFDFGM